MKRKNKTLLLKRIGKILPVLFVAVSFVYVGLLLKDLEMPTVLPIDDVAVSGNLKFVDRKKIESIVKNNINGGYFTVDLNAMRDELKQLPWIKNISLRRQWPAKLDVIISERTAVAYWNNDGYISETGEVFNPEVIDNSLHLPKLNGPAGHHDNVWKFLNELYQEMALLEFEVVRLDLDDRRSWQMKIAAYDEPAKTAVLASDIEVKLGRFETGKRVKRFIRILPSLMNEQALANKTLTDKNIKVIDMRYPNGFAVQHHDVQQGELQQYDLQRHVLQQRDLQQAEA